MKIAKYLIAVFFPIFSFAQSKPNVILILSDDQGWGDLSINGNTMLQTPNIDKLAKAGQRFSNFYVSPLCAPTRASLLTGRYHLKTGVVSVSKGLETMDTDETTLAELFKANGYKTGIFGKWHNGQHYPNRPTDQGFDEFLGFMAGHLSNYFDADLTRNENTRPTKGYITDVLTDAAIKYIDQNKQEPFLCYIPYNAPHSPHQVPEEYFTKYKSKGIDNELASIYGMVDNMDHNIGRIMDYLQKSKLLDNTIVIFLTDNGPNGKRYNGDMKGQKGSVNEGGVRVPFFITWKNKIPANSLVQRPAAHIDIYPTLAELCGLKPVQGKPLDGLSLAADMKNTNNALPKARNIYTHVNFMEIPAKPSPGGFRNNRYRFVLENGRPQLYDLQNDPQQKTDIASQNIELVSKYESDYKLWFENQTTDLSYDRSIMLTEKGAFLPTYEAMLSEGLKFKEGHGWAHDWLAILNTSSDSLYWEIDCQKPGKYTVEMEYLCKKEDLGSVFDLTVGSQNIRSQIKEDFYPSQKPSPDRVPRKEAFEMEAWKKVVIGQFELKKGKNIVKLKAVRVANKNVMELNGLRFKYISKI
jgi:arylsulfatase A-like enzyme